MPIKRLMVKCSVVIEWNSLRGLSTLSKKRHSTADCFEIEIGIK